MEKSKTMAKSKTNFFPNFSWAIPKAFADPLSTCRFEQGDTLYEKESAYNLPWSDVRKIPGRAIQVLSPSRGVSSKTPGQDDSAFAENWNSEVIFELRDLQGDKCDSVTTTQGRLYSFLWLGNEDILDGDTDSPPVPRSASALKKLLPEATKLFSAELLPDPDQIRFFLPADLAAGLYHDKYLNVKEKLQAEFETTVQLEPAGILGGSTPFLPTVHVASFTMKNTTGDLVEDALQSVLYKPAPGRKGVARFRLKTHGLLM